MKKHLKNKIKKARPNLKLIAPLSYATIKGFGVFNILLGIALMFHRADNTADSETLIIIHEAFGFMVWGLAFMVLGIIKLHALHSNDWQRIRKILIIAMLFHSIWLFALLIHVLVGQGALSILVMWGFLTYIQALIYIHFIPLKYKGS